MKKVVYKSIFVITILLMLPFCNCKRVIKENKIINRDSIQIKTLRNILFFSKGSEKDIVNYDILKDLFQDLLEQKIPNSFNSYFLLKVNGEGNKENLYLPILLFKRTETRHFPWGSDVFSIDNTFKDSLFIYDNNKHFSKKEFREKLFEVYNNQKNTKISHSYINLYVSILIDKNYNDRNLNAIINEMAVVFNEILEKESNYYFKKKFYNLDKEELKFLTKNLEYLNFYRIVLDNLEIKKPPL